MGSGCPGVRREGRAGRRKSGIADEEKCEVAIARSRRKYQPSWDQIAKEVDTGSERTLLPEECHRGADAQILHQGNGTKQYQILGGKGGGWDVDDVSAEGRIT